MNYAAFEELENGTLTRRTDEPEQAYMERIFREVCRSDGFCGPDTPCSIHRINDMLAPEFAACSAEEQSLTLSLTVREWMLNPRGTLHGGIMSTMLDMAMGMLTRYYRKTNLVSTVSLSVNYLRPVQPGEQVAIRAEVQKLGRRVLFMQAQLRSGGKTAASATATFM